MPSSVRSVAAAFLLSLPFLLAATQPASLLAASTTLVIHEFRTRGPNGGFDEFIEVRNISGGGISLNGWNVIASNGSGLQEVRANLPNVVLGAGCSWLLGNSQPTGYTGAVDQPYAIGITDDGGIALQQPGGGVVDSVGMSGGSAFGEGTRLSQLTTNTNRSYERVGADTDNNAANFALRNPSTPTTSGGGCTAPPPTPTPPTLTASVSPTTVDAGNVVLLRATVTPGATPTSTGLQVNADLSTIGGGVVPLFDNGTNGDQTSGDLVFSRNVTVAAPTMGGTKTIPLGVVDAQGRTGTAFVSLVVTAVNPPTPPTAQLNSGPFVRLSTARVSAFVTPGANPTSTGLRVVLNLTPLGGGATTELSNAGGALCDQTAGDPTFTACLQLSSAVPAGPVVLTGLVSDAQGRSTALSFNTAVTAGSDSDSDGLLDSFEGCFGLDLNSGAGDNGPAGDPDGDGLTNLQEQAGGTHPRGFFTRYLAEGVTNSFFQTRVALFDIGSPQGSMTNIRVQPEGLPERSFCTIVPRLGRRTLTPEDTATFSSAPFATVVESDYELVVDRTMMWGAGLYGSHAETAVFAPSTTWTLAEGATGWRFSLFYLLQNPSDQPADVAVSYLRGGTDPVLTRTYTVPARQRRTIAVDDEQFPAGSGIRPLASTDVSSHIDVTNGVPIIVERAMYMSPDDQPFGAGTAASGVPSPGMSWFFAEGSTGTFFDEFILLANGEASAADVTIVFTPEGRAPISRSYTVAPNSRATVWVDQVPGLEATAVSATVTSSVPIVAERAMWWPGSGDSWREGHVTAGATTSGPRWAVADLELGGPNDANSFVLIYGGGNGTVYFDDGSAPVACGSSTGGRFTLHVNTCPGVAGKRFVSIIVNGNASTVVERVTYFNTGGELFGAGGGALATRIP
jgi:hypothetical protein